MKLCFDALPLHRDRLDGKWDYRGTMKLAQLQYLFQAKEVLKHLDECILRNRRCATQKQADEAHRRWAMQKQAEAETARL